MSHGIKKGGLHRVVTQTKFKYKHVWYQMKGYSKKKIKINWNFVFKDIRTY